MITDNYSVTNIKVGNLLSDAQTGNIAIPEIQRPFVWSGSKVRDLIDSLYKNYPVGYIITWKSQNVRIKDGQSSNGRLILIDGQQRITALSTALSRTEIVDTDYRKKRIVISFNPITEEFKVKDRGTERGTEWIADIADVLDPTLALRKFQDEYLNSNSISDLQQDEICSRLDTLRALVNAEVGNITLDANLDIETVTEIFVRINATGVSLSQADFIMSRIAVFEKENGDEFGMLLRKWIDYFCEIATNADSKEKIETNDTRFIRTDYWNRAKWVSDFDNKIYMPKYNDILRVISLVEFNRGRLGELVALLAGRDFETRTNKEEIALTSFEKLESGIGKFTWKNNFEHFVQDILYNLGLYKTGLFVPQNALNYVYAIYLRAKDLGLDDSNLKRLTRKLLVLTLLTSRHSGNFETTWTSDFQNMKTTTSLEELVTTLERQNFTEVFWDEIIPQHFGYASTKNPYWTLFALAQIRLGNQSFLGTTLVRDMQTAQVHHIYPKVYLTNNGFPRQSQYNQLANFAYLHDQINNLVNDIVPHDYISKVRKFDGAFGNELHNDGEFQNNLVDNAIPSMITDGDKSNYEEFLQQRSKLMSTKIREFYNSL